MATTETASIITLHQPQPKKAKTPAERARAYRERKKAAAVWDGDHRALVPTTALAYSRPLQEAAPLIVTSRSVTSRRCC